MFIRIVHPTTITGLGRVTAKQILGLTGGEALPLIARGIATPIKFAASPTPDDPELDALKGKARKLGQRVDWDKHPMRARWPTIIGAASSYPQAAEEDFGTRISRAVKERVAVKQANERASAERGRYLGRGGVHPRQRTKGE